MTDLKGTIVWQATYRAWGEIDALAVSEIEQNLRFQGQYFDDETGLHYNTFRYYDPGVGRFTTQDPIGLSGGANLYRYVNNPMQWVDPLGLDALSKLAERGYSGVVQNSAGGLNYAESNALYAKNPNVNSIVSIEYSGIILRTLNWLTERRVWLKRALPEDMCGIT